jgi:predicted enzyme related to lactoylglutathione lyase
MVAQAPYSLSIVCLEVRDWPGMVVFYRDVLGLEAIELDPESEYGWLRAGPITLALRGVSEPAATQGTRVSLQFEVPIIERAVEALERAGCRFYIKRMNADDSYKIAYCYDPEGNALAVFEQR